MPGTQRARVICVTGGGWRGGGHVACAAAGHANAARTITPRTRRTALLSLFPAPPGGARRVCKGENVGGRLRVPLEGQGRQDSNLQPPVLETGALPVELRPSVRPGECR